MFSHLNGQNHKLKVALEKDPHANWHRAALNRFTVKHSQNNDELSKLIKTIQSDAAYPWPAGKNPRGRERGGPGEIKLEDRADTGGRGGVGGRKLKRPLRAESEERQGRIGGGFGAETRGARLPYSDSLVRPQSKEEGEEMIEMGKRLFDLVLRSDFPKLDRRQKESLSKVVEKVLSQRP